MKFPESKLAHKYLDGLKGIEIGGSAHNPFGLDTINVDYTDAITPYKEEELALCRTMLKVDVVSLGDNLPFPNKSYDFVISSHVIEHFFDPIKAIKEWERVARKYIYIIAPHMDRMFDADKIPTKPDELWDRYNGKIINETPEDHSHYSYWRTADFVNLIETIGLKIKEVQDRDDKVGNGFAVLISLEND